MFVLRKIKIANIIGDANNPRVLKENKSDLLSLSLRKYGLLSPLYISSRGMLLSGHQRTKVLSSLGEEFVYIVEVKEIGNKSLTNSLNFMFNKEMQGIESREEVDEQKLIDLKAKLEQLPDIEDRYQSLKNMQLVEVEKIKTTDIVTPKLINNSGTLHKYFGIVLPLIVNEKFEILNGNARYHYYSKKYKAIPCVVVPDMDASVFKLITGQYSFSGKHSNIRQEQRRHYVDHRFGKALRRLILGNKAEDYSNVFFMHYIKKTMPNILDFGSGNGKQSAIFRKKGINITLFEPFVANWREGGGISIKQTYDSISTTLDEIEKNRIFDMVKANAVINSIPFEDDRQKVILLLKFLAAGSSMLIVCGRGLLNLEQSIKKGTAVRIEGMPDNVIVSSKGKTKIQTFHTVRNLVEMLIDGSDNTYDTIDGSGVWIKVNKPVYKIDKKELMAAVEMEFSMEYNSRVFTDLLVRARKIFSDRYDDALSKGLILQ